MSSAGVGLTLQYSALNQPQTISAPANVQPYSQFTTKLRGILAGVQGGLGSSARRRRLIGAERGSARPTSPSTASASSAPAAT